MSKRCCIWTHSPSIAGSTHNTAPRAQAAASLPDQTRRCAARASPPAGFTPRTYQPVAHDDDMFLPGKPLGSAKVGELAILPRFNRVQQRFQQPGLVRLQRCLVHHGMVDVCSAGICKTHGRISFQCFARATELQTDIFTSSPSNRFKP